jgi:hypothetical protein
MDVNLGLPILRKEHNLRVSENMVLRIGMLKEVT